MSNERGATAEAGPSTIDRLMAGYYPAVALLAGMQLELFTPLARGAMTAPELAAALGVGAKRLAPLLYHLVAAGMLELRGGRFANTPEAETYLVKANPRYIGSVHELLADLYQAALHTAASIRTDCPQAKHDFEAMSEAELGAFFRGLHANAVPEGRRLAEERDFGRLRSFLDVGGGSGGASIGACEACPGLRATVAELPSIVSITEACVAEAGLGARIGVQAVDVSEARPEGIYDAALLRNLIQVLSADDARRVLRNTAAALRPEGEIYLIGHVLDDDRVAPPEVAAFNLVFINIYDDGQAYTESEYRGWLEDAGFVGFERQPLPRGRSLIAARKKT